MIDITNEPRGFGPCVAQVKEKSVVSRLWAHDHTLWQKKPDEVSNRLAWLHLPETMPDVLPDIDRFVHDVRKEGYRDVLLLGMGGSSLAPETFLRAWGPAQGHPRLRVLDSTHPKAVRAAESALDLEDTLVLVATKSGTTPETLSLFRYLWNRVAGNIGEARAGRRFATITDPGSPLLGEARRLEFRRIFENEPNLGGRYSALSHFGLVPARLLGVNARDLLASARDVSQACTSETRSDRNPAVRLGALLALAAAQGRDKLTLVLSDRIASFGDWLEQLIAESTGKRGRGILPVLERRLGDPSVYGSDRVFVRLRLPGDSTFDASIDALAAAGHPVVHLEVPEVSALGGQFFLWEMATAVAGHLLRINPFDQPNVEESKRSAREIVETYRTSGTRPPSVTKPATPEALDRFLATGTLGDYVALQAYIPPTPDAQGALAELQHTIRDSRQLAVTVGFGPRFLHSTGQLHKGDRGNGLFVQFVSDAGEDLPIPDTAGGSGSSLSFGALIAAQSAGDRRALLAAGRRVLSLELGSGAEAQELAELSRGLG